MLLSGTYSWPALLCSAQKLETQRVFLSENFFWSDSYPALEQSGAITHCGNIIRQLLQVETWNTGIGEIWMFRAKELHSLSSLKFNLNSTDPKVVCSPWRARRPCPRGPWLWRGCESARQRDADSRLAQSEARETTRRYDAAARRSGSSLASVDSTGRCCLPSPRPQHHSHSESR